MNIIEIYKTFPSQEDCIKYLEKVKWNNEPRCPYCNSTKHSKTKYDNRYFCSNCRTSYSATVGTIFHDSKIPLQKWFLAICLVLNAKKGISSRQLARDIEVNKNTAWRMQMQIRKAMNETPSLLSGIVEMDETYIGGKPRKSNNKDDDNNITPLKRGRGTKKTAVVGMVQRHGKVIAKKQSKLSFMDLKRTAKESIDFNNSILMTDDYRGYIPFKNFINHQTVNHSNKQYVDGFKHTNTIEGFWGLLKRGITGQYHWLSDKYLNRYINEFCFKYNNRQNKNIFELLLINAVR
ncbi:MAG TPA: IS1595 family transposase [Rickettsiales bacterium]|nr:IS1595 family transposase [Rickettsiales bacterium]